MRKFLILTIALLGLSVPSFAVGILKFMPPTTVAGLPGDTVDLSATLQNIGDAPLFVNDLVFSFGAASSFLSGTFQFSNVPGLFLPTDPAWTGVLAQITLDPAAAAGVYSGTIKVLGGASSGNFNPQTDVISTISVTTVVNPEPGTCGFLLIGVAALLLIARSGIVRSGR